MVGDGGWWRWWRWWRWDSKNFSSSFYFNSYHQLLLYFHLLPRHRLEGKKTLFLILTIQMMLAPLTPDAGRHAAPAAQHLQHSTTTIYPHLIPGTLLPQH